MAGVPGPAADRIEAAHDVLLRRLDPNDADGLFVVHADPRVYAFDPEETHPHLAHTRTFLAPMLRHWAEHGFGYWTVLVPTDWSDNSAIGSLESDAGRRIAGLGGIQHHTLHGQPALNVHFRFAVAVHGRGLGGTVIQHATRLAPTVAPGIDIVVRTRPANAVARRVAERSGFVDEGLEPGDPDMQLLRLRARSDPLRRTER